METRMTAGASGPASETVDLHREDLAVERRTVETGRVQIRTIVNERKEQVDQLLRSEGFEIERVAVGHRVDRAPPVREEGDTIILPVVEEVLVVEKHLILREEIHVRRIVGEERHRETVTLRSEDIAVSRTPAEGDPAHASSGAAGPGSSDRTRTAEGTKL
jgi:uncharacterized protein (TIGR02271 family)